MSDYTNTFEDKLDMLYDVVCRRLAANHSEADWGRDREIQEAVRGFEHFFTPELALAFVSLAKKVHAYKLESARGNHQVDERILMYRALEGVEGKIK